MTDAPHPSGPALPALDMLPEHTRYQDTGCVMAPACLRCHLPICIYDDPRGLRGATQQERDADIARRLAGGEHSDALAREYGISRRQVFRILRRLRVEPAE